MTRHLLLLAPLQTWESAFARTANNQKLHKQTGVMVLHGKECVFIHGCGFFWCASPLFLDLSFSCFRGFPCTITLLGRPFWTYSFFFWSTGFYSRWERLPQEQRWISLVGFGCIRRDIKTDIYARAEIVSLFTMIFCVLFLDSANLE